LFHGHFSEQKGSELIHVIEGNLLVTLKGRTARLFEGDSVYLKDSFPSQWKNEGGETAKIIAIS